MSWPNMRIESGRRCRWQVARRASHEELRPLGDLDPLLGQLLRNRGLLDSGQARSFLTAEDEPLGDPLLMAGMEAALARLRTAIQLGELIAIYGDYDVDGLTATAVLCNALGALGAQVLPFIPHREKDGYGLQDGPLAELRAAGAGLVVTVDCGVTATREIATARAAGLDVIVTDHHLVPAELPQAAVLNPHRSDCSYPFKDLAGVGVAFKLAQGLLREHLPAPEAERLLDDLLELVAIGTLSYVVPLRG
jgi:single-stranded-DNA-specific exonuclease